MIIADSEPTATPTTSLPTEESPTTEPVVPLEEQKKFQDLRLVENKDFLEIYTKNAGQLLAKIGIGVWQGNADIYPVTGGTRAGHLWSELLMFSPGNWLTDKAESEGLVLESYGTTSSEGESVGYKGKWRFRNLFETEASHKFWADENYVFHAVEADMEMKSDINDVAAVWIELMNKSGSYKKIATKHRTGIKEMEISGKTNKHYLDELELDNGGWVAIYGAAENQQGSAALVLMESSSSVKPRWFDGENIDNIELHLLDPRATRMLKAGQKFHIKYMVLASNQPNDYLWVDDAMNKAGKN